MELLNTNTRYGAVAILFHWALAILVMTNLVLGLYMVSLPDVGFNTQKIYLILFHKGIGAIVLCLIAPRFLWRLINLVPTLPHHMSHWQVLTARFTHGCLYVLMVAIPITGWLMSSAAGFPLMLTEAIEFPNLIQPNPNLIQYYIDLHKWLAFGLIAILTLHVGAALKHHFMDKDHIMLRIISWW